MSEQDINELTELFRILKGWREEQDRFAPLDEERRAKTLH